MELTDWREFDCGEEWFSGRVLWVWAPRWERPRLAIADRGDDFDWFYEGGPKLEDATTEYPTHCCDLVPPMPPADGAGRKTTTMNIKKILAEIEAEHSDRREQVGGVLLQRNDADRIAEITKHLGDAWGAGDLRTQMIKVAAVAIEAIEQHDLLDVHRVAFEANVSG